MSTASRDGTVIRVTDRSGVTVEATWNPDGAWERPDGSPARGYWQTEAGWITPDEAVGWEPSLARALSNV